jgi:hypothetical protein
MTLLRAMLCLAAGAALLAACSKPGAPAANGPDVVITQADLPKMKPGLWTTSVSENGQPATSSQHCETGEQVGMADVSKECSKFVFKRTALGAIVIDADCASDGSSSTMHMTVSGDYNAHVTGDAQVTMKLPGNPPMVIATHAESTYVGACPAGSAG